MGEAAEPFRSIDRLLATEIGARSLDAALRLGWIDRLIAEPAAVAQLPGAGELHPAGLALLVGQLQAIGVVEGEATLALTPAFRRVLEARELLEARLWFLLAIAPDIHQRFDLLLKSPGAFVQAAEVFRIFDYSSASDQPVRGREDGALGAYTTALTRHEGRSSHHCSGSRARGGCSMSAAIAVSLGCASAQLAPALEVSSGGPASRMRAGRAQH